MQFHYFNFLPTYAMIYVNVCLIELIFSEDPKSYVHIDIALF